MRGIHRLQPVVVADEAHLLDREMLEEVRFLLNFKMDAQNPMALILVGQSELWDRLDFKTTRRFGNALICSANCRTMIAIKPERTSSGIWRTLGLIEIFSPMERLTISIAFQAEPPG